MYGGALGKKTSRPLLLPGFDAPGRHQHNHHLHHHWCHHWYHYCYCLCHQYIQQQPFTTSNKLFWLFGQLLCWRTKKQYQFRIKSLAAASSIVFRGEERERVGLERRKEWQLVTPPPPHPNISKERDTTLDKDDVDGRLFTRTRSRFCGDIEPWTGFVPPIEFSSVSKAAPFIRPSKTYWRSIWASCKHCGVFGSWLKNNKCY